MTSPSCVPAEEFSQLSSSLLNLNGMFKTEIYFCGPDAPDNLKCECPSVFTCNEHKIHWGDIGQCGCCPGWVVGLIVMLLIAFCVSGLVAAYLCMCRGTWWCDGHEDPPPLVLPARSAPVAVSQGAPVGANIFRGYRPTEFDTGRRPGGAGAGGGGAAEGARLLGPQEQPRSTRRRNPPTGRGGGGGASSSPPQLQLAAAGAAGFYPTAAAAAAPTTSGANMSPPVSVGGAADSPDRQQQQDNNSAAMLARQRRVMSPPTSARNDSSDLSASTGSGPGGGVAAVSVASAASAGAGAGAGGQQQQRPTQTGLFRDMISSDDEDMTDIAAA